jgi:rSAM/selenodomain-associated transferase 1
MRPLDQSVRDRALVIFARSPLAGRSKTRLIPLLGAARAAAFQRALCLDALSKVAALRKRLVPYFAVTGPGFHSEPKLKEEIFSAALLRQRGADLGERLANAFAYLLRRHFYVAAIGTDSPELAPAMILRAFRELRAYDAVLGPCPDGGYYLVGLRRGLGRDRLKEMFRGIRWGTRWTRADTSKNLAQWGLECAMLEPCADIDRPADLVGLCRRMSQNPSSRRRAPQSWKFLNAELGAGFRKPR